MARTPKGHNSCWWDEQEGRLRRYIDATPDIEGMTFAEVHHGIGECDLGPPYGGIAKYALAELCRLQGLKLADSQIAH